jgi:di/tricarboxylate transporter
MKNKDLFIYIGIIIISTFLGYWTCDEEFNRYSEIVTLLSIIIGFEITSLSILFNSPLKRTLYDRNIKYYKTELHRLRDLYRFSIYVSLISVLLVILLPEFSLTICKNMTIHKCIIVLPILSSSVYCFIKLCNDLFRIFVYPTNEK